MTDVPFIYGSLAEKDSFIDRETDRAALKDFLLHGINTILVSPRRWGKSSLVRETMKELVKEEKNVKVCFLDAYKIHSEEEFYNKFASAVIQGVSGMFKKRLDEFIRFINRFSTSISLTGDPANMIDVNLKINPAKESPERILRLPEKIAAEKHIKVIVCIDEFQQLANIPNWKHLEAVLRSEWQLQHLTTYCLYGSKMHMMTQIFSNSQSPFFRFGQIMHLKCIAKEFWIPYIIRNFKKTGKSITAIHAERICDTVRYNSWYVQQYSFFVWLRTKTAVDDSILADSLQFVLDTNEEVFQNETDDMSSSQIALLKAVAAGEVHFNAKDIVEKYNLGLPQTITRNKKVLIEKDLVEKQKQRLTFVDPVFELWIKREYALT